MSGRGDFVRIYASRVCFDNTQSFVSGGLGDDTLTVDGSFPSVLFIQNYIDSYFVYGFENIDMTAGERQIAYVDEVTVLAESDSQSLRVTGTAEDWLFLYGTWQSQAAGDYVIYSSPTGAVVEVAAVMGTYLNI